MVSSTLHETMYGCSFFDDSYEHHAPRSNTAKPLTYTPQKLPSVILPRTLYKITLPSTHKAAQRTG